MGRRWLGFLFVMAMSLLVVGAKPARADSRGEWKKLGERTVQGRVDRDVIQVGADDGVFTAIQVKVENSSLQMFDIKVVFGNGESFSPNTRLVFGREATTRVIDLPGEKRVIRRVEFRYGNLPGGGNARVELWGKAGAPPPPPPPPSTAGWKKLGERPVNGRLDRDVIQVGADDGAFTSIQIKVENSALEMFDVKVVFGNGESFSPNTRLVFGRDSVSRVIDLPGAARVIRRVEFRYGNLPGGGNARVELWGKAAALPPPPPAAGWRKLGERPVNGRLDRDVIQVGADDGTFSTIQVVVTDSALEMFDIKVVFANGESFSPNTRLVFGPGSTTRAIDLPGARRVIRRVEFRYGNLPGGGNARVTLLGK